jgi:alanine or glycine:cation symporter, AGCS family
MSRLLTLLAVLLFALPARAAEQSWDQSIDSAFKPIAEWLGSIIFFKVSVGGQQAPFVIFWLGGGALLLTLLFKFINLSGIKIAYDTVRMKYSRRDDPGEITAFQALAAALSGTVGLGNIAGVAIGVSAGGPGVVFWLFMTGLLGMTTKFCECTLGVRYREIDANGKVYGGSFYTLSKGLAEIGLAPLGKVMAVFFAIFCVGGAFGGGNMFQVNQAYSQFAQLMGPESWWSSHGWVFGLIVAILTGLTIIGGIKSIASVTDKLTPALLCERSLHHFDQHRWAAQCHWLDRERGLLVEGRHRGDARRDDLGRASRGLLE